MAEDLGVITPAVARLRDSLGFPVMVVLQFGFDPDDADSVHRFENHAVERVVYTGTHDHDTARGWYSSLPDPVRTEVDAVVARAAMPFASRPRRESCFERGACSTSSSRTP